MYVCCWEIKRSVQLYAVQLPREVMAAGIARSSDHRERPDDTESTSCSAQRTKLDATMSRHATHLPIPTKGKDMRVGRSPLVPVKPGERQSAWMTRVGLGFGKWRSGAMVVG